MATIEYQQQPFKRGDVVEYSVEGVDDMTHWAHLNGRLGVLLKVDVPTYAGLSGAMVKWITLESYPADRDDSPYPYRLLRKIGHIDDFPQG